MDGHNDMEKKIYFDSLSEWWDYSLKVCAEFANGVLGVMFAIIFGVVSFFVWIGKLIEAFCRRETVAAIVIGVIFLGMTFGWVFTFTKERHAAVTAQHKADSLAYDLSKYTQFVKPDDVLVLNGDTINH